MNILHVHVVCASAAALAIVSVALAMPGSPGWEWGRLHCGRFGNPPSKDLAACIKCCKDTVPLSYPNDSIGHCASLCKTIYFNPVGTSLGLVN